MTEHASSYHRGDMEITEQVTTFRDAMKVTKWASLTVAVGVLFLTLLFCTDTGFLGSLVPAVIVAGVGVFALKSRGAAH